MRSVEIRTYQLHSGAAAEFERLFDEEAVPMLARWGIDVVAFVPSRGDPDAYGLIRAFDDLNARQRIEEAFYASTEWRDGPRAAILALIESYADLVLELDEPTINGLRAERR
jgi:hypothetical protein